MASMKDIMRKVAEDAEKTNFYSKLEEMGFEHINFIQLSKDSKYDLGSNGKNGKENGNFGFDNNRIDDGWYTENFIRNKQDPYSNDPSIVLELKRNVKIGTQIEIHSIPWIPSYYFKTEKFVNRKEILNILRGYLKKAE